MPPSTFTNAEQRATSPPSSRLSALQSVVFLPERYSQGMASTTSLRKIASLKIESFVERNGKSYYVVDVYLQKASSRIPTSTTQSQSQQLISSPLEMDTRQREPNFRVERRFSEFTSLRSKVYSLTQNSHNLMRCNFCSEIVDSTLLGNDQPKSYMGFVHRRSANAPILTQYLCNLMRTTLCSRRRINGAHECEALEQVPQLLLAFLQPEPDVF